MGKGAGKGGLVTYDNGEFWAVIFALEGSIFDNVASKIVTVCVISFIAAALNTQGYFDNSPDSVVEPINKFGFTLAGSAIAFLLVLRSQISYGRFWEGRGHLGNIMGASRDLVRQLAMSVKNDQGETMEPDGNPSDFAKVLDYAKKKHGFEPYGGKYDVPRGVQTEYLKMCGVRRMQMIRCVLIFWRLLVYHARDEDKGEKGQKKMEQLWAVAADKDEPTKRKALTTFHQEELLKKQARRPLVAVSMLTQYLRYEYKAGNLTSIEFESMNQNLKAMITGFNGVDKVHTVQIPFPYAQMILLFLTMYVFTAPFLFCAYFGWFTCIPSTILCLAYFGINEIALEIEDPFGEDENDLPMEQMGDALKVDCEMFMEVAGVPVGNIKVYWEQIAKSKQRWKIVEAQKIAEQAATEQRNQEEQMQRATKQAELKTSSVKQPTRGFGAGGSALAVTTN